MGLLENTGHPFIDIGRAAIKAYVECDSQDDLTEADWEKAAEFIRDNYVVAPMTSALSMSLPNSAFTQPAFDEAKKREYAEIIRDGLRADAPHSDEQCIYTGEPAMGMPLSFKDDLAPGRAFRQHIPMIAGEGQINFFPDGDAGLPVSVKALLALQFMPMGCAKCGGKLLAVHSDDARLTLDFARVFFDRNQKDIALARSTDSTKLAGFAQPQRTLLIKTLLEAEDKRGRRRAERPAASITAYYFTNSGQGPDLTIYYLPMHILTFLSLAQSTEYRHDWNAVVNAAWQRPKRGEEEGFVPRQNYLYEDLFDLETPQQWRRFVSTYFLRRPRRTKGPDDPRSRYTLREDLWLVSWPLVELFLHEVAFMNQARIDKIRTLGDRLAEYVRWQDTTNKFFDQFFKVDRPGYLRTMLINANKRYIAAGYQPLYMLEDYLDIFLEVIEEGEEVPRSDWRLARDLVLMRMIDQLRKELAAHPEDLPAEDLPITDDDENTSEE